MKAQRATVETPDVSGYDVYSEFDVEKHTKKYINYLEVLILEDGTVKYAVPSHQELAIKLACQKMNLTRDQLNSVCPHEYYGDFLTWLLMQINAISVWNDFYVGTPNDAQIATLRMLKEKHAYKGEI